MRGRRAQQVRGGEGRTWGRDALEPQAAAPPRQEERSPRAVVCAPSLHACPAAPSSPRHHLCYALPCPSAAASPSPRSSSRRGGAKCNARREAQKWDARGSGGCTGGETEARSVALCLHSTARRKWASRDAPAAMPPPLCCRPLAPLQFSCGMCCGMCKAMRHLHCGWNAVSDAISKGHAPIRALGVALSPRRAPTTQCKPPGIQVRPRTPQRHRSRLVEWSAEVPGDCSVQHCDSSLPPHFATTPTPAKQALKTKNGNYLTRALLACTNQ